MRRQDGICVVNAKEMRGIKFEGIIVPEVNIPFEIIKVKEGRNSNGKYILKDLFSTEIPEGIGTKTFKEILNALIVTKGLCDFQIPDILISEKVLNFLKG